ncbi:hypothetical protein AQUCO_01000123v1 [Aquilegia coerulea]|uniref:Uncharacterized protein n=1 Tax=Aquilegia coerulea TaxID=218851 RepID=A0A2G5E8F2_AQUCA|nr:hypothetical protein AQUCO_01000123v1 [Aquilegia coerulea]
MPPISMYVPDTNDITSLCSSLIIHATYQCVNQFDDLLAELMRHISVMSLARLDRWTHYRVYQFMALGMLLS